MTSHPNRSRNRSATAPGVSPKASEVRALRERHNLSQSDLATACAAGGVTLRAVQAWEQDERRCHPGVWRYVLAQLGELTLPE